VERMRYEGLESMTRKQVDEVEQNVSNAEAKYEQNKESLERINKILVNAKAGIEHICEKLGDIKIEGFQQIQVTDNTLVDALQHCEQRLEYVYKKAKNEPLYEEAMEKM